MNDCILVNFCKYRSRTRTMFITHSVAFIIVILCAVPVTYVNKLLNMVTLIGSSSCPSELSNISALTASNEGQLAVATNDGVFILVSRKIVIHSNRSIHKINRQKTILLFELEVTQECGYLVN